MSTTSNINSKLPTSLSNKQHPQPQQPHHHQQPPPLTVQHPQQKQHQNNILNPVLHQQQSAQQQPPRYQPPPQPGILKHISGGSTKVPVSNFYQSEVSHLNIKYPPEVPKLATIYLPEGIKNSGGSSRIVPPRSSQLRLSGGSSSGQNHNRIQTEEEYLQRQQQHQKEMLKFVRKTDSENSAPATNQTRLSADQNRHLQGLIGELRALKEANQRLSDDNQELRDLCCFLDDDRQKGRKLAREWQRFGRYTASVMRQEVSAYQSKLRQLDDKQQELIRDNLELKELCLYLDEERANAAANALCTNCGTTTMGPTLRDDGDGSSTSTTADEPMPNMRQFELNIRPSLSDQTLQYVRSLEKKIHQLEEERSEPVTTNTTPVPDPLAGRPEAVVRALQVLEVREQLERDRVGSAATPIEQSMDDGEKALVREMCNVVWRKLEDGPNGPGMEHM